MKVILRMMNLQSPIMEVEESPDRKIIMARPKRRKLSSMIKNEAATSESNVCKLTFHESGEGFYLNSEYVSFYDLDRIS